MLRNRSLAVSAATSSIPAHASSTSVHAPLVLWLDLILAWRARDIDRSRNRLLPRFALRRGLMETANRWLAANVWLGRMKRRSRSGETGSGRSSSC
jgi:hypothetical protein